MGYHLLLWISDCPQGGGLRREVALQVILFAQKQVSIYQKVQYLFIVRNNRTVRQNSESLFLLEPFRPRSGAHPHATLRRRITPETGRGLELLAHAIEYLTDEFVQAGSEVGRDYGRVQAMQLLASINRQLYFSCEVRTTLTERVRSVLRRF